MKASIVAIGILFALSTQAADKALLTCLPFNSSKVAFWDPNTGLNRLNSIEVIGTIPGDGGDGIIIKLSGTSGVGDKAVAQTKQLKWASAQGHEMTYNNRTSKSEHSIENPYIELSFESMGKKNLATLNVLMIKDTQIFGLYSSRYTCR